MTEATTVAVTNYEVMRHLTRPCLVLVLDRRP